MELLRVEDAVRWCRAQEGLVLFHGCPGGAFETAAACVVMTWRLDSDHREA